MRDPVIIIFYTMPTVLFIRGIVFYILQKKKMNMASISNTKPVVLIRLLTTNVNKAEAAYAALMVDNILSTTTACLFVPRKVPYWVLYSPYT